MGHINSYLTYLNGNYNKVNRRGAITNCPSAKATFFSDQTLKIFALWKQQWNNG
jgi:hypothetical protein